MSEDFRGRVLRTPFVQRELAVYAAMLPVGTAVRHVSGWTGTVREDNADHVPGIHLGRPTAHCLANEEGTSVLVCVAIANASRLTWLAWVALEAIERTEADRTNEPVLAVSRRRGRVSVAPAPSTPPASPGTPLYDCPTGAQR